MCKYKLGIYEKALPKNLTWHERLAVAKSCGFDYVEMSIDETDERLARLEWDKSQRLEIVKACLDTGITIPSICLSGHRKFPFGSLDQKTRDEAFNIMDKAIKLAVDIGVRTIQLAGYDVYYEEHNQQTIDYFCEGLKRAVEQAAASQVMLSVEIMDTDFINSITKWKYWDQIIASPWFSVYPDVGNLSAWNNNLTQELTLGIDKIAAIHLKDTYPVNENSKGQFRDVPFGDGCVDFVNVFSTLQKLNYRGSFVIEMWSEKSQQPVAEIIKAKQWIENKMKEGGFLC